VQALANQKLFLAKEGEESRPVAVQSVQTLSPSYAGRPLLRRVTLDAEVEYADFPNENPIVTVYGNLISATQGKTQDEVVVGSGDQRQIFQTFAVPKAPLTYLLDETQTPAQVPELHVTVDGIEWQRVDSFFNAAPDAAVYIVREDEEGKSFVQFGDGKTGRRLPSGRNNVSAIYRVGQGAHGELKEGTNPQAIGKLNHFDKLFLPAAVTGGCGPEEADNARVAAPGKMQSLGRMVSLADIEAEALAIPHVIKARAVWSAPEGVPLVRLTVLTESGSAADVQALRDTLRTFNRCRGPARFPIDVVPGIRQYVYIHVEAGFEAARRAADVIAAVKQAIGLAGEEGNGIDGSEGLFGLKTRAFGQGAHPSQIIGAVQNAMGVTWVNLKAAQIINLGTPPQIDPTQLAKPGVDIVNSTLACPDDRLLALHATHFTLSLSKDEVARECEA
jgi:predicted phage baseplate assembly protein